MLEKNKDYLEMRVSSTDCAFTQNAATQISVDGYVYTTYMDVPDPGEFYILISKEKFEKMQAANEQLKQKINELRDDISGRSTVIEHYKRDVTRLQARAESKAKLARQWEEDYNLLLKKTGFDAVAELIDYLDDTECDTLYEAILKLIDENKYACEKWCSTNSSNNFWKAAAECNSPKELIEKREALEKEIGIYSRTLQEWKEGTGCPSPSAAKTLIESGMSWYHAYNEIKKANEKLGDDVNSWKNVTGYSTPEDYLAARISGAFHTPFDYTAAWQKATGCDTSEAAKCRINNLIGEAEAWESDYNHLLALTGFDNEGEIEDFLEQNNDRNKLTTVIDNLKLENEAMKTALRASNLAMQKEIESNIDEWQKFTGCDSPQKAGCKINSLCDEICKLKGDYDHLLELTGYKNEHDIRVALNYSEQFVYETMRELINSLKRKAKFAESGWQLATGCKYPSEARILLEKWKALTKCETPEAAATWITSYESACERGNRLAQDIEAWKKATSCSTPEVAEDWVNELGEANGKLAQAVLSWQNVTGFKTPEDAKDYWVAKLSESGESNESLAREVRSWREATGCKTPDKAKSAIKYYRARLGNSVQSASIAMKMLGNSVQSEASAMEILETIGYIDPIKED